VWRRTEFHKRAVVCEPYFTCVIAEVQEDSRTFIFFKEVQMSQMYMDIILTLNENRPDQSGGHHLQYMPDHDYSVVTQMRNFVPLT
jgi:hypothetical protein